LHNNLVPQFTVNHRHRMSFAVLEIFRRIFRFKPLFKRSAILLKWLISFFELAAFVSVQLISTLGTVVRQALRYILLKDCLQVVSVCNS